MVQAQFMPDGWTVKRLADVMAPVVRSSRRVEVEDGVEYSLISVGLYGHGVSLKERIRGSRLKTKTWFRVKAGDFVLLKIWGRKGAYGFVKEDYGNAIVSGDYPILALNRDQVDQEYAEFFLKQPSAWRRLQSGAKGATSRQRVHERDFLSLVEIPIPSLPEQRAITGVLNTVQRSSEATNEVISATRALKKSLTHYLFERGPVAIDQAGSVTVRDTEIGPIPDHWKVAPLSDGLVKTQYGSSQRGEPTGQIPILRMNNIRDGHIALRDLQFVQDSNLEKFKLNVGDVLFNRTNSHDLVGKVALFQAEGDFVFASYLIRLICNPKIISPEFLSYYLNSERVQRRLKGLASRGVSQSNISASKLRAFLVAIPPVDEQRGIVDAMKAVDIRIGIEAKRSGALKVLFNSLLSQLMTGAIRVAE